MYESKWESIDYLSSAFIKGIFASMFLFCNFVSFVDMNYMIAKHGSVENARKAHYEKLKSRDLTEKIAHTVFALPGESLSYLTTEYPREEVFK